MQDILIFGVRQRPQLGDVKITATITERHSRKATIQRYPIETGSRLSENRTIEPFALDMEGIISDIGSATDPREAQTAIGLQRLPVADQIPVKLGVIEQPDSSPGLKISVDTPGWLTKLVVGALPNLANIPGSIGGTGGLIAGLGASVLLDQAAQAILSKAVVRITGEPQEPMSPLRAVIRQSGIAASSVEESALANRPSFTAVQAQGPAPVSDQDSAIGAFRTLVSMFESGDLFSVVTNLDVYPNMQFESFEVNREMSTGSVIAFSASLVEVLFADSQTVTLKPEKDKSKLGNKQNLGKKGTGDAPDAVQKTTAKQLKDAAVSGVRSLFGGGG